ncbi:hypothetical protein [uncultured Parabacteroides sp.]|uniref:hypothetical protein n=1 Tax=uncultured Parabacteroides sp. TaxID=512312 RepID=UPI0025F02671|nr:hypothetical protein [uncultured Parabacteroides sp.]
MDAALRGFYLNVPKSDVKLFQQLAKKMGWTVSDKDAILDKYIQSRPENVELSDEDILKELNSVRYDK